MTISVRAMMVTPFDEHGGLHVEGLRQHVDRIATAGIDMFVGGSSPGQGYTLTPDETTTLYEVSHEVAGDRAKIFASGFEPRTSSELIELSGRVKDAGIDGMQVYCLDIGHGGRPSERELERYFRQVLDAIELPAVISTHQNMGYLLSTELLEVLVHDYPHVTGLHVNTGNMSYVGDAVDVARDSGRDVSVHNGFAGYGMSAIALGADGFLSAEANIAPHLCAEIIAAWTSGDMTAAFGAYQHLLALSPLLELGSATRGIKGAMRLLGRPGHHIREPLLPLDAEEVARITTSLEKAGLSPGTP